MKSCIWEWFDDEFVVYCENNDDYNRIIRWKGTQHRSTYFFPDGSQRYDLTIPRNLVNRAAKLLGLTIRVRRCAKSTKPTAQVVGPQQGDFGESSR